MARPFKVTWYYQNDEEILTTTIWYNDPTSATLLSPEDLANIAAAIQTNIAGGMAAVQGKEVYSHAIEVSSPVVANSGPGRHINPHNVIVGDLGTDAHSDLIVMNVQLRGESNAGRPVTGGMRLSGIHKAETDCNNIKEAYASAAEASLDVVFPEFLNAGGSTYTRSIRHNIPEGGIEYVAAKFLNVARRVGTMLDRVGNRPQSRSTTSGSEIGP